MSSPSYIITKTEVLREVLSYVGCGRRWGQQKFVNYSDFCPTLGFDENMFDTTKSCKFKTN